MSGGLTPCRPCRRVGRVAVSAVSGCRCVGICVCVYVFMLRLTCVHVCMPVSNVCTTSYASIKKLRIYLNLNQRKLIKQSKTTGLIIK